MPIITISREFGSGGRELGKHLAELLGWDYYDREIISAIAEKQGMDEHYVEKALENRAWQSDPLTFHGSFVGSANAVQTNLLVEQKRVIDGIAKLGRSCVIVGRNSDVLLKEYAPFNLFVCASLDAKIQRCLDRAVAGAELSPREVEMQMRVIDKNRAQTREIISGIQWGARENYHLTVNTTGWDLKELAPAVAEFAQRWFEKEQK